MMTYTHRDRNGVATFERAGKGSPLLIVPGEAEIGDIGQIVDALGEPVHLSGWSYGGLLAIEAAAAGLAVRSLIAYERVSRPFAPQTIAPTRPVPQFGMSGRYYE